MSTIKGLNFDSIFLDEVPMSGLSKMTNAELKAALSKININVPEVREEQQAKESGTHRHCSGCNGRKSFRSWAQVKGRKRMVIVDCKVCKGKGYLTLLETSDKVGSF